ncbi:MAG TPA: phospholipase D-like domain-containing protein, partial [Gemmatimonadales bacterium]|nr:phospholipase D-like domain-containing protein [Gemmatimonadales bacterium]
MTGIDPRQVDNVPTDLTERVLARTTGGRAIPGNAVRLLHDGPEAFPEMLGLLQEARHAVAFENYIVRSDATGRRFAEALASAARRGVRVRVLYDWIGSKATRSRYWRLLRAAGVEVRSFNRPRLTDAYGSFARDHRKLVVADGRAAVIGGLCIGDEWQGDPARGNPPWRDTAVLVRGPAAAGLALAFSHTWALAGGTAEPPEDPPPAGGNGGGAAIHVIQTVPGRARIARLLELLAAGAVTRIWLTDAYTVVLPQLRSALQDAARAGVDVRLLVPGSSDLPLVRNLTRFGYRDLLRAGVRIFEWNGPMLHAKEFVADGRWTRIGSSNLNPSSFLGNYELDVLVDDPAFAAAAELQFRRDLARSSEIVVRPRRLTPALHRLGPMLPTAFDRSSPEEALPVGRPRLRERGSRAVRTLRSVLAGARRSVFGPLAAVLLGLAALFAFLPRAMAALG